MIDASILCLIATDQSNHCLGKYRELDNHVNQDLNKTHYEPIKQVFTKAIRYDFLKRYVEIGVKKTNQEIIDIVRKERPRYVLWSSMNYEIQENTFQTIRDEGTIVIGWFYDDECRFEDYSKWWVPYLDYIFTTDKDAVHKYKELGGRSIRALVYSNPDYFRRLDIPVKYDVSFVGTNIADRAFFIDRLKKGGIHVHTFGKGWDAGYISFDEMINIYNVSMINLGFVKSYGSDSRPQMKNKIFDICMCGGFLLCEYMDGIEEFYNIDKEIVCFRDIGEVIDKVKYYLNHEDERRAIAQAGWERTLCDHSIDVRLLNMFYKIENEVENKVNKANHYNEVLEMPLPVRNIPSMYHSHWARALMLEGFKDLWQDELKLSLSYNRSNRAALFLYTVGYLPAFIRRWLIKTYTILGGFKQALYFRWQRLKEYNLTI